MPAMISVSERSHGGQIRPLLASAGLTFLYARARAPHPAAAVANFCRLEYSALQRMLRLGLSRHVNLARLELECAQAGLSYPHGAGAPGPPWRLPDDFASMACSDLPAHPAIDATLLAQLNDCSPEAPDDAVNCLRQLLLPDGLSARWNGIRRIGEREHRRPTTARIAVCLHLFYPELWPALRLELEVIPEPWDLYVTVPEFACTDALRRIAADHPATYFLPCKNRGRDVLPFLRLLELGVLDPYEAVCKLHGKRSLHMKDGAQWLARVLASMLGSSKAVAKLLQHLRGRPTVGLVGPKGLAIRSGNPLHRAGNHRAVVALAEKAALSPAAQDSPFFAGTMFWFRPAALDGLRALALTDDDFPLEMGQTDGTTAHAIERLIWPLVEQGGYEVVEI
jgi:hypothetical protein